MFKMPTEREVQRLRQKYPAGSKVELIRMDDPYTHLKYGDRGTVIGVDDMGQIMVNWDKGGKLSLIPEVDEFRRISQ